MVAGGEVSEFDRVGGAWVEELIGVREEGVGFAVGGFDVGEVLLRGLLMTCAGIVVGGKAYH